METLRFVDLFAGMGGFHAALRSLGHECVFASEIDAELRELYVKNFPDAVGRVFGDIRESKALVPSHDVLCAGFPCQPFSKSGRQLGTMDATRGTLFHEILEILQRHAPPYVLLENVGNFERHDGGRTWDIVRQSLIDLGYDVRGTEHVTPRPLHDWRDHSSNGKAAKLNGTSSNRHAARGHGLISPHHFGFPQHRERFFVVAVHGRLPADPFPIGNRSTKTALTDVVDKALDSSELLETSLSAQQIHCVDHWNGFLKAVPSDVEIPSFPLWGDELGAKYPFEATTPWASPPSVLRKCIPGRRFPPYTRKEKLLTHLPSYARRPDVAFPGWKKTFIRQNREWWTRVRSHLSDDWVRALRAFPPSLRKLEWNLKGEERDLWRHVLQFRPSGLRAKRYTSSPALIAMTVTQIPLLGPERRFLTRKEGLRLQGFPENHALPRTRADAFAALGNAVHVGVARRIAAKLLAVPTGEPRERGVPSRAEPSSSSRPLASRF